MPREFRSVWILTLFASLVVLAFWLPSAQAQAPLQSYDYQVLIDHDGNEATGYSVTPTGGAVLSAFEHRLRVKVDSTAGGPEVTSLERQPCSGAGFDAGVAISQPATPPWPVAVNAGVAGADAIELGVPLAAIAPPEASSLRLVFVADDGAGSDVMATVDGTLAGGVITLGVSGEPIGVPVFSMGGLIVLLLGVILVGLLGHRRLGHIGAVSAVLLIAGVAWAMNFMAEGSLEDWSGVAPVGQDATGDAFGGDDGNDLVAGFAAVEGGAAYVRIDDVDVENQAPSAVDDDYSVAEDTPLSVAAPGVLGNDTDAESGSLTAVLDAGPTRAASFSLGADGSFDYTPEPEFNGTDSFTYFANDGLADSSPATVTITVDPVNDAPTADNGSVAVVVNESVDITLVGDDVDGVSLTFSVGMAPANGTLGGVSQLTATTAAVTYTPDTDFNGNDSFTFTASDGAFDSAAVTIAIDVRPANEPPSITLDGTRFVGIEGTTSYTFDATNELFVGYFFDDPEGATVCGGDPCFDDLWYELRFISAPETAPGEEPFTYLTPFDRFGILDEKTVVFPTESGDDDLGYIQWQSDPEKATAILDNFRIRLNEPGEYVLELIVLDNGRSGACPAGIAIPADGATWTPAAFEAPWAATAT